MTEGCGGHANQYVVLMERATRSGDMMNLVGFIELNGLLNCYYDAGLWVMGRYF